MRTPNLPRLMTRFLVVASIAGLAACGSDNVGPSQEPAPDTTPSGDGVTRLRMTNESNTSAWYVYVRQCGQTSWGPDRLGAANVLSPGESVSWSTSKPGCYDIRARSAPGAGEKEARWDGITVAQEHTTQVNIHEADWE